MAQTYEELGALSQDPAFRTRIKIACLHFANYILNEAPNAPAHNTRVGWARECYKNPDQKAFEAQSPTCMEDAVVASGSAVTDTELQSAVETALGKLI